MFDTAINTKVGFLWSVAAGPANLAMWELALKPRLAVYRGQMVSLPTFGERMERAHSAKSVESWWPF